VRRIAESSIYGEIVQAVPVVIGGLLAVGGGVIAQIATHWLSISRDERNFRRERLEQLVKALFTHQVWLEDKFQAMVFRLEDHNVPDPLNEVRMLQALHFPELAKEVSAVGEAQLPLLSFIRTQKIARMKDKAPVQWDEKPYIEAYRVYKARIYDATAKCRKLLPSPQPTLLDGLWKLVNKMDGK
jgi:hypothetical protein